MNFLHPLTKSSYIRIGALLGLFYVSVQWLNSHSKLDRTVLIQDLRSTAQDLAALSSKAPTPETLRMMHRRGLITEDLLRRCEEAKVTFHQENITNEDGLPVFTIPDDKASSTRVTATGLVLK